MVVYESGLSADLPAHSTNSKSAFFWSRVMASRCAFSKSLELRKVTRDLKVRGSLAAIA